MGWSLKGILAGAGKGMADWAGREIAAEKQAERDAAQFERQKEMSRYNDELAGAREERSLELKDKFLEKKAASERERETETLRLGDEDAKAAGLKPGTKEYNLFMGDFLRQSNFTTLGEKYVAQADKFDDNDLRKRQLDIQEKGNSIQAAGIAESRAHRFAQAEREEDRHTMQRADNMLFKVLDNYKVESPTDPSKQIIDPTVITAASDIRSGYEAFLYNKAIESGDKKPNKAEIYKKASDFAISVASAANRPDFKHLTSMGDRMKAEAQRRADEANKKKN